MLGWGSVIPEPIGFDHEPQLGPEEVDPVPVDSLLGQRRGKTRAANQPDEPPLQLGVGEGEGAPIEDSAQRWSAVHASVCL